MNPNDLIFAPIMLPLLGAALAFCAKAFLKNRDTRMIESLSALIGLGLPLLSLFYLLPQVMHGRSLELFIGNWPGEIGIHYRFDGIAWLVNLLGYSVASTAWIYSLGAGPRGPGFTTTFLIQTAAMAATAMTADLFNLFVCLEVMGIASYILVASSEKPGAFLASFSYLMISATAMVFFLLGLMGFYRITGSLSYETIAEVLRQLPDSGGLEASASLALIAAAVAIRVAIMPLYGWLPDAHALAPHAISAVLSGVLIKAPLFALSRILIPHAGRPGDRQAYELYRSSSGSCRCDNSPLPERHQTAPGLSFHKSDWLYCGRLGRGCMERPDNPGRTGFSLRRHSFMPSTMPCSKAFSF